MENLNKIGKTIKVESKVIKTIKALNNNKPLSNNIYSRFTNWIWDRLLCRDLNELPGYMKNIFSQLEKLYEKYDVANWIETWKVGSRWFWYAQRHAKIWFSTTKTDRINNKIEIVEALINKITDSKDLILPVKILKHEFRFFYNQEEYWIGKYWVVWATVKDSWECDWWNHVTPKFRDKIHEFISNNWIRGVWQNDWERVFDFRVLKENIW